MGRPALHVAAAVIALAAAFGWACSVTPHFVASGGSGGASSSSAATSVSAASTSSSGGGSSASASATTSASSSAASSSSGSVDKCMGVTCTASDQCHDTGTCDPGTGTCSNPSRTNGTPCTQGDPCIVGATCQNGTCAGTPLSCSGGQVCQGGTCVCPAQHLLCNGTCIDMGTACSNPQCNQCGVSAACDGTVITDPTLGYQATCKSSLGSCDATNAQSSYAADQIEYHAGISYVCLKLDGTYGWTKLVLSVNVGGPGCQSGYMACDYLCSANMSYSVFCDPQNNWDPNLIVASAYGCPSYYPTLPGTYACP